MNKCSWFINNSTSLDCIITSRLNHEYCSGSFPIHQYFYEVCGVNFKKHFKMGDSYD